MASVVYGPLAAAGVAAAVVAAGVAFAAPGYGSETAPLELEQPIFEKRLNKINYTFQKTFGL